MTAAEFTRASGTAPTTLIRPSRVATHRRRSSGMSEAASVVSIAVHGAAGRMGRRLIALGSGDRQLRIVAAVDSPTQPQIGVDVGTLAGVGPLGIPLVESLGSAAPDVVIDFSVPVASEMITAV